MKISLIESKNSVNTIKSGNFNSPQNGRINSNNVSFKGDYFDETYWGGPKDENNLDALRAHFLYRLGAYECLKGDPFKIEAEKLSPKESKKLKFDYDALKKLNIENMTITTDRKGVRGSCILSEKHRDELDKIKKAGIDCVIDLRSLREAEPFQELCDKNGMQYIQFPLSTENKMDYDGINERVLPELLQAFDNGNYYIACNEGINRTDITIALNYLVNPKEKVVPLLKSKAPTMAIKYAKKDFDKILESKNKESDNAVNQYVQLLGWQDYDTFHEEYTKRYKRIIDANKLRTK